MGNAPSKTPGDHGGPSQGQGVDKKVIRRTSIQALSGNKATAADPSATKESATGRPASQQQQTVHHRLQSRNIPGSPRGVERSDTRGSRRIREGDRYDLPVHSKEQNMSPEPSKAVQVPTGPDRRPSYRQEHRSRSISGPSVSTYYGASSHLRHPPRLPLPIGDATTAPGSPIQASEDSLPHPSSLDRPDLAFSQERSVLGESVNDDEDITNELEPYPMSDLNKAVATTFEWRGPAEKAYVTGTFVNWERKFKLQRSQSDESVFTITLQLRPGTHHLKFIVDGVMRTSDNLPTAVDFTNHLVNYVEVSADEIQRTQKRSEKQQVVIPPDIHPPKVIPEYLQMEAEAEQEEKEEPEEEIPLGDFRSVIPQFLVDIDHDEDSPRYQQAANIISESSAPPILPLFLGRSILNGTTPMKDDNSVLNYPNHTVLNHLATSSIKNGVLATSVTTRYKRKYVTTILYKPTGDITD